MKLINKTHWNTRDVRRLVIAVANREIDKEHKQKLKVTVEYQRGRRGKLGYAYYNDHRIWIRLPRRGDVDPAQTAKVIAHELMHNRGVKHRDLSRTVAYGWLEGWRDYWAWAMAAAHEPKKD